MNNFIKAVCNKFTKSIAEIRQSRREAKVFADDNLYNVREYKGSLFIICGGVAVEVCNNKCTAKQIVDSIETMRKAQRLYNDLKYSE